MRKSSPTPRTPKFRTPEPSRSSRRTTPSATSCECSCLLTSRFDSPATCSPTPWRTRSTSRSKRTVITLQSMPCRRRPKTCRRRWRVYGKCSRNRWRLPNTPQSRSNLAPDRPRPPHFVFRCFFCTGIQQCTGREAMVGWGAVLNMLFSWFSF